MKKYLLGLLILGVTVALATTVYADWAEVSESSTRDVEWAGEMKTGQTHSKQVGDLKLRQLSEQAEQLTTATTAASLVRSAASVDAVSNTSEKTSNDSAVNESVKDNFAAKEAGLDSGGGIAGLGSSGQGNDNPTADNPGGVGGNDGAPFDDVVLIPDNGADDSIPLIVDKLDPLPPEPEPNQDTATRVMGVDQ